MPTAARRRGAPVEDDQPQDDGLEPGASPGSSTGSSAASDLLADAGPEFQPGQGEPEDQERRGFTLRPDQETVLALEWQQDTVQGLLEAQGSAMHGLIGKTDGDWVYTRHELHAIAGPLTRILNRYPMTRAAAAQGDELAVLMGFTGYTLRSIQERREALAAEQPDEATPPNTPFDPATTAVNGGTP